MTSVETDTVEKTGQFVEGLIQSVIGRPSTRDEQKMPGPSDISDPCDLCLARKIAGVCGIPMQGGRNGSFSLKAWVGTAVHEKIEQDLPKIYTRAQQEVEVDIAQIPGLGMVKGHVDLYLPDKQHLTDWKTADMEGVYGIKKYKREGPSKRHIGQTSLYAYGLNRAEMPVKGITLVYIPRDSNRRTDIWRYTFPYEEAIAEALLKRLGLLTSVLQSGQTAELTSDPDCFVCNYSFRT